MTFSQNRNLNYQPKDLKNPGVYSHLVEDHSVEEVLILSGNAEKLLEIDPNEVKKCNEYLRRNKKPTLVELALLYGDLTALNNLLVIGLQVPNDDESVKNYLRILFTGFGQKNSGDNDIYTYNKTAKNIREIYEFLVSTLGNDNALWTDKKFLSKLVPFTVHGNESSTLDALSIYITDYNQVDTSGRTALFYLMARHDNPKLINKIMKRGAALNHKDRSALKLVEFASEFGVVIARGNKEEIQKYLDLLTKNRIVLDADLLLHCVNQAIQVNDKQTVIALLSLENAIELELYSFQKTDDLDMLYTIACHYKGNKRIPSEFGHDILQFSHRIGLSGKVTGRFVDTVRSYTLEGSAARDSLSILSSSLSAFTSQDKDFQPICEAARFVANLYVFARGETAAQLLMRYYAEGNPILLAPGWTDHIIGLGVLYHAETDTTYICIANRGSKGLRPCITDTVSTGLHLVGSVPGTVVYNMTGKLNLDFFTTFSCEFGFPRFIDDAEFNKALNIFLKGARFIILLPAPTQAQGTCSYVNQKRICEGLLLIFKLCMIAFGEGLLKDEGLLKKVYEKYQLFSIFDKSQACKDLSAFYTRHTSKIDRNPIELDVVSQLVIEVVLSHHSMKNDAAELKSARELYAILPQQQQKMIAKLLPEVAGTSDLQKLTIFSPGTKINILGRLDNIERHYSIVMDLIAFLTMLNIDNHQIRAIRVLDDAFVITTKNSRETKYKMRDEVFVAKLGADVLNIEGKFEFIVRNPTKLALPFKKDKKPSPF